MFIFLLSKGWLHEAASVNRQYRIWRDVRVTFALTHGMNIKNRQAHCIMYYTIL